MSADLILCIAVACRSLSYVVKGCGEAIRPLSSCQFPSACFRIVSSGSLGSLYPTFPEYLRIVVLWKM
jgi:hypothetical protein